MKPKDDGLAATECGLLPAYKLETADSIDGSDVGMGQDVSWTARFVDRISEVAASINVSGTYPQYL